MNSTWHRCGATGVCSARKTKKRWRNAPSKAACARAIPSSCKTACKAMRVSALACGGGAGRRRSSRTCNRSSLSWARVRLRRAPEAHHARRRSFLRRPRVLPRGLEVLRRRGFEDDQADSRRLGPASTLRELFRTARSARLATIPRWGSCSAPTRTTPWSNTHLPRTNSRSSRAVINSTCRLWRSYRRSCGAN